MKVNLKKKKEKEKIKVKNEVNTSDKALFLAIYSYWQVNYVFLLAFDKKKKTLKAVG